ncbi:MAG: MFS transporter [Candidatus Aenigmatarchaeota archaeon]
MGYKANLWKMYAINLFLMMHLFAAIIIPFFTEWIGFNFTQIFLLQAWFMASIFFLEIPTGTIADRYGRKASIALAAFVNAAAALIYANTTNFFVFMFAEFLWATAFALLSGADQALLYDTLKKIRKQKIAKKVFARYQQAGSIGIILGAPLGSMIAAATTLRMPVLLSALPLTVAGLIALTLAEPLTRRKIETTRYWKIMKEGIKYFTKHGTLKILAFDMALVAAITHFIFWFYQPMLTNAGVGIFYFGFMTVGMNIVAIALLHYIDQIEKFFGTRKLIFVSTIVPGLCFVAAGLTNFLPVVIVAPLLIMGFKAIREPIFGHHMNRYIPTPKRATVLSTVSMLRRFIIAAIYPFIGMLTDWNFSYTLMILGAVLIAMAFFSKVEESMVKE